MEQQSGRSHLCTHSGRCIHKANSALNLLLFALLYSQTFCAAQGQGHLPPGEMPSGLAPAMLEKLRPLKLLSGKLFKIDKNVAYLSTDDGKTWNPGGKINPYSGPASPLDDTVSIQIQKGPHQGRIVIPHYLEMDAEHPDYSREQQGGYAIWKGKWLELETHTYVPELGGSYMCYSDDEGKTWKASKGFLMGYFGDGHQGLWSCEEPTVAELKDGRLLCFMRSTTGLVLKSYSNDGGKYWNKVQATDIANSNSPAVLKRIPSTGDLVLVWNQMSADEIRRGYRRGRLSVAISKDDGETWINYKTLELSAGVLPVDRVTPEPLQAMVRGPQNKGVIPDGYTFYSYPQVFFDEGSIYIYYIISFPENPPGPTPTKLRKFPITWLYQE